MRPISGFSFCAARSRIHDALAALLVASPGSEPPGSPNLSPRVSAATLPGFLPTACHFFGIQVAERAALFAQRRLGLGKAAAEPLTGDSQRVFRIDLELT